MRVPDRLIPLLEMGVIHDVVRPLMSGKEAAVYLVEFEGELRVAKVYKEAHERSFHQRADYMEGRKTRNTRDQRAMAKKSRFGREQMESSWRTSEVDAIYKLRAANVSVPEPYDFVDGVLVMELIRGMDGHPAPRLVDVALTHDEARDLMRFLLRQVVWMLCAGVIHGDLSDFNVLLGRDGPVIIDFPQWVDPAHNRNARRLLIRDVENVTRFLSRFAPELLDFRFAGEMWDLYERGQLRPDTTLTGRWAARERRANVDQVVDEIQAAAREEARRRGEVVPAAGPPQGGQRPRPRGRAAAVANFFEGLSWPSASESKKGPAARQVAPPPEPPRRPEAPAVESPAAHRRRRRGERRDGARGGSEEG